MSRDLYKKGIVTLVVFTVLAAVTILFFTMTSTAWFKEDRVITLGSSSYIKSITMGVSNSLASFKNQDEFDSDLHFGKDTQEFEQRFIPGDILFYTFIVPDVAVGNEVDYIVRFFDNSSSVENDVPVPDYAYHLQIQKDSVVVAVLQTEEQDDDENPNYSIFDGKFYYPSDGVKNDLVKRFASIADIQNEQPLDVSFRLRLPQGINYPQQSVTADFLIIVPILYLDNGVNQNFEMDHELIIAECRLMMYTGDWDD